MSPLHLMILAQLEHVDLSRALEHLLGTGGSALVLGLVARQWVSSRLRDLEHLKKTAEAARVWRTLARRHMRAQARELNRLASNLHELGDFTQSLSGELERIADAAKVRTRKLPPPEWKRSQLPVELDLQLDGDDDGDDAAEKEEA